MRGIDHGVFRQNDRGTANKRDITRNRQDCRGGKVKRTADGETCDNGQRTFTFQDKRVARINGSALAGALIDREGLAACDFNRRRAENLRGRVAVEGERLVKLEVGGSARRAEFDLAVRAIRLVVR